MKKPNEEDLLNGWLKYHNTSVEEVKERYSDDELMNGRFYDLFPVTQEQHDEWKVWAKEYIRRTTKYPKKLIDRAWAFIYLDTAPKVERE